MPRKRRSKSKTLKVKFTQKKVSNRFERNLNTAVGGFSGAVIGSLGRIKFLLEKPTPELEQVLYWEAPL